jgi:hypothetical protein
LAVALRVGAWFARCGFGAFHGYAQILKPESGSGYLLDCGDTLRF